jgi:hypothetical protein
MPFRRRNDGFGRASSSGCSSACAPTVTAAAPAIASAEGRQSYAGTIDGAKFRVEVQLAELGPGYQRVLDFGTFLDAPMAPAFTRFAPPESLRPSR